MIIGLFSTQLIMSILFLALGRSRLGLAYLDKVNQIKNDFLSVSKLNIYLSLKWWGVF